MKEMYATAILAKIIIIVICVTMFKQFVSSFFAPLNTHSIYTLNENS